MQKNNYSHLPTQHTFNFKVKVNYQQGNVSIIGPHNQQPVRTNITYSSNPHVPSINASKCQSTYVIENPDEQINCVICQRSYDSKDFHEHLEFHKNRPSMIQKKTEPQQYSFQQPLKASSVSSQNSINSLPVSFKNSIVRSKNSPQSFNGQLSINSSKCFSVNESKSEPGNPPINQSHRSLTFISGGDDNKSQQIIPQVHSFKSVPLKESYCSSKAQVFELSQQEQFSQEKLNPFQKRALSFQQELLKYENDSDEENDEQIPQPLENLSREEMIKLYHSKASNKFPGTQSTIKDKSQSQNDSFSVGEAMIKTIQSRQVVRGVQANEPSIMNTSKVSNSSSSSKFKLPKNYLALNDFIETNSVKSQKK